MAQMNGVIIIFIIFASITGVILGIIYLRNRNRERLKMIEKGADPSVFKSETKTDGKISLKIGIFLIALAIGIITGSLIANNTYIFAESEVAYFSAIFLFGGLGLLGTQLIDKKKKK
jgi:uncharacterized membrane protein YciS (DUF1049 family)